LHSLQILKKNTCTTKCVSKQIKATWQATKIVSSTENLKKVEYISVSAKFFKLPSNRVHYSKYSPWLNLSCLSVGELQTFHNK